MEESECSCDNHPYENPVAVAVGLRVLPSAINAIRKGRKARAITPETANLAIQAISQAVKELRKNR